MDAASRCGSNSGSGRNLKISVGQLQWLDVLLLLYLLVHVVIVVELLLLVELLLHLLLNLHLLLLLRCLHPIWALRVGHLWLLHVHHIGRHTLLHELLWHWVAKELLLLACHLVLKAHHVWCEKVCWEEVVQGEVVGVHASAFQVGFLGIGLLQSLCSCFNTTKVCNDIVR